LAEKKASQLPDLKTTLIVPDPNDPDATTLELDALWAFVLKKTKHAWIWIALCRTTRQVVAYAIGDRSEATCRKLWRAIPKEYVLEHVIAIFGRPMRRLFQKHSMKQLVKKRVRQRMLSAGIIPSAND